MIKRSFGVLKACVSILKKMPPYPFDIQRNIVVASMAVYNFIRKETFADRYVCEYEFENVVLERSNNGNNRIPETDEAIDIREQIETSDVKDAIMNALLQS